MATAPTIVEADPWIRRRRPNALKCGFLFTIIPFDFGEAEVMIVAGHRSNA
jgi:hypothetical protein